MWVTAKHQDCLQYLYVLHNLLYILSSSLSLIPKNKPNRSTFFSPFLSHSISISSLSVTKVKVFTHCSKKSHLFLLPPLLSLSLNFDAFFVERES
ncbi:hypothetical protein L2E82_05802 [Cichorium intybus]|uniref:Uncharacterized protein n=1 Tax=Cichorium intybus TaxID=13427 RepID=A0ACB9H9L6_CICIN|nr:hypothetical protein L2E82_05802 [Cichorium intybus]